MIAVRNRMNEGADNEAAQCQFLGSRAGALARTPLTAIWSKAMSSLNHDIVLAELTAAAESGDADVIEDWMNHGFEIGFRPSFTPVLIALLGQTAHHRHEDVVSAIQDLKDPRAVDALYSAVFVEHEYLAYDEFFGLARKCTWALADIGTPSARNRLEVLTQHEHRLIARYAKKRLDGWDDELDRKGAAIQ
jgi:hypothetical protein